MTSKQIEAKSADEPKEYVREKTGRQISCPDESHEDQDSDECELCGMRGQVDELAPVDLAKAIAEGLDVNVDDLDEAQLEKVEEMIQRSEADPVLVRRKVPDGYLSYFVYRWSSAA